MEHYIHHKHRVHHRKKKVAKTILFVILGLLFVFASLRILDATFYSNPDNANGNATSTPVVVKPPIKPIAKPVNEISIEVYPEIIHQGDPALIVVDGLMDISSVKSFTLDGRPLAIFLYKGYVSALYGVDLRSAAGTFPLVMTLNDGTQIKGEINIYERTIVKQPFGIPEKFGGDTPQAERNLIQSLIDESNVINSLPITYQRYWTEDFGLPLKIPMKVDDPFGYTRITGNSLLSHKGTDLNAAIGTPVYAMNKGMVSLARNLQNGGGTVIIDHGVGLQTVYMHLSEIKAVEGQSVEKGDLIGLSGDTGYVLHPHLHLTVRVWEIAVDAMKFIELFGDKN